MDVIEVRDLEFRRGRRPILHGLNFGIGEHELVGLIGPNGGGKTTLLQVILGVLRPQAGSVTVFGRSPEERGARRSQLGYVAQIKGFETDFPARAIDVVLMGTYAEVGLFRLPGREHRRRAEEVLDSVGMAGRAERPVGNLSGGERQRVFIAQALVSRPQVLILDEPTSGVDREGEEAIMELLVRLRKEAGLTVFLVSHNVSLIRNHTDRILCLNRELVYNGSAAGLSDAVIAQAYHAHPGTSA